MVSQENLYKLETRIGRKGIPYTFKKNLYRDWIIDAFYYSMLCGGRNEEAFNMKWCDIITNEEGQMSYVLY